MPPVEAGIVSRIPIPVAECVVVDSNAAGMFHEGILGDFLFDLPVLRKGFCLLLFAEGSHIISSKLRRLSPT